jgi:antitoxin (DNA-binding transcriptional repressor) of toxin-antitoxin stability system
MADDRRPRWIDAARLPEDVLALIEALRPGEDLFIVRDGEPIAEISRTLRTSRTAERLAEDDDVTVVATAMKLSAQARAKLSEQLGPGYIVLDMHSAPKSAEVLLVPPISPQLIGNLRNSFPEARVVIAEIEDAEHGVLYEGPVRRLLNAGAEAYLPASTIPGLAKQLDRTITHLNQLGAGSTPEPLVIESAPVDDE